MSDNRDQKKNDNNPTRTLDDDLKGIDNALQGTTTGDLMKLLRYAPGIGKKAGQVIGTAPAAAIEGLSAAKRAKDRISS